MEIAIIILLSIIILLQVVLIVFSKKNNGILTDNDLSKFNKAVDERLKNQRELLEEKNKSFIEQVSIKLDNINVKIDSFVSQSFEQFKSMNDALLSQQRGNTDLFNTMIEKVLTMSNEVKEKLSLELKDFSKGLDDDFERLEKGLKEGLKEIRDDNKNQLELINRSVNEKLETALNERLKQSFENVSQQISSVNNAIGEIKGIAQDVGSLKNVLTNVKTKGIVGEVILSNIIKEIFTENQYEADFNVKPRTTERVEFAIKMPGQIENEFIYLPIDSKFPLELYSAVKDAHDNSDLIKIEAARKDLRRVLKSYAKDISSKYIDVPKTTEYALMFLPIEGLYLEVLNMNLFEEIQREYHVIIVGPTTLTALLNALQMGFKSLMIQKRSAEVFKLLASIKTEYKTFAEVLDATQQQLSKASDNLDKLVGVRTRQINRNLENLDDIDFIE